MRFHVFLLPFLIFPSQVWANHQLNNPLFEKQGKKPDTTVVKTFVEKMPVTKKDWTDNFINFTVGLLGIGLGAGLTRYYTKIKDNVDYAFQLHGEFNGIEMSSLRHSAFTLIEKNLDKNFKELMKHDVQANAHAVFVVMRFYQKLWFSVKHGRISHRIIKDLFDDMFYYWYYVYFEHHLVPIGWKVGDDLKDFAIWFEKHLDKKRHDLLLAGKIAERRDLLNQNTAGTGNAIEPVAL